MHQLFLGYEPSEITVSLHRSISLVAGVGVEPTMTFRSLGYEPSVLTATHTLRHYFLVAGVGLEPTYSAL